jgi:hypothetical protein
MITYDWNCKTVDVHPQEEGETDVVYNVHWIVTGTKEDYSATSIGTQVVPLDPETPFIPFDELTNEVVVGWTKNAMGEEQVQSIEDGIASQIAELENPTSITMTIGEQPEPPVTIEE